MSEHTLFTYNAYHLPDASSRYQLCILYMAQHRDSLFLIVA